MADPTTLAPMTTEAFKDCDIRGTYPEQVNEDIFARVGREFGRLLAGEPHDAQTGPTIVISGDGRNSTHTLMEATIQGLSASSIDIVDLGYPLPTPAVYWAKDHLGAQASAIVTASHNPANWDGLKVMIGEMPPRPDDIRLLADRASASAEVPLSGPGRVRKLETVAEDYMAAMIARFNGQRLDGLKVVVDPGNGCMSGIASQVLRELGAEVVAIYDEIDPVFSQRNPDCAVAENLSVLVRTVVEEDAAFGVGFDGDGDRIAVVDDKGRLVGSERLAMILFEGAVPAGDRNVILDIKCSMHLDRAIAAHGGTACRCKSGHAYMKRMVLEEAAVAGVELSGHVFLGEINGRDDPLHTSLLLAGWLASQDRPLSAFVDAFPEMFMTDDIRIAMDKAEIDTLLADCAEGLAGAEVQKIDGVRLVWPNGWLLVRRSITEPKVTIRLEGETGADLRAIGETFSARFPFLRADIETALAKLEIA